jgi:hypothetical protein
MKLLNFAVAIALMLLVGLAASAQTYNVVTDFSLASNPNGVWSYGYLATPRAPLTLYTFSDDQNCVSGISFWGLYLGPCSLLPVLGHNDTKGIVCWATDCLPPNYVVTSPGYEGQLGVVRWTAPASGTYGLQGAVMGTDCVYPTSTDLRVIRNSTQELFRTAVNNCDVPLSFQYQISFSAGDTLDFVVDWGRNGNPYGDGTGIQFKVTKID